MLLTFREAASLIGQRSRSTIYRWLEDGWLEHAGYLRGKPGHWRIESAPPALRPFRDWARGMLGPQGPMRLIEPAPPEPPEPEPAPSPWAHLPEQLQAADGSEPFWLSWGRIAGPDEPPLTDAEFWQNVHSITEGMMGEPLGMTPTGLADLAYHMGEAQDDVAAGARWDATQWACESARTLLDYPEVRDGSCPHSRPELERLAAGGVLTPELQAAADAALAAYAARVSDD
jgi:hypothetical protein